MSHDWLALMPLVLWSLLVAAAGGLAIGTFRLQPGFFLYLALATGLLSLTRWHLAQPNLDQRHTTALLRMAILQAVLVPLAVAVLMSVGRPGTALTTAVVGVLIVGGAWPWRRALRWTEEDRRRPYRSTSFLSSLVFGTLALLVGLLNGAMALATSASSATAWALAGLHLAEAASTFIEAWDERRRPKRLLTR